MSNPKVRVDNGKFTFAIDNVSHAVVIYRHGELWHEQRDAFNALHSIMCELDAARVVLAAARYLSKMGMAPLELENALRLHSGLVSDMEHPSEWAVPSQPKETR